MVLEELTDWLIRVCNVGLGHERVRIRHGQPYLSYDDADDEQESQKPYRVKDSRRVVRQGNAEYQPRMSA
jgi:hypothetical protein